MDHLRELRGRLLCSVAVFILGAVAGYFVRSQAIVYLQQPLGQKLYYTTPTGSFEFVMQICGVIGLIVALPVLIYNLLRFIEPALPRGFSKTVVVMTIALSFLLAVGGAAFAYYISLPSALKFFSAVGTNHLSALISVDQYFRFVFTYLATFAIVFQLPLILFLVDYIKPLGPGGMRRGRKFVVIGSFAVALITPSAPDPLSQMILALPIILLYEVSIIVVWLRASKRARVAKRSRPTVAKPAPVMAAAPIAPAAVPTPRMTTAAMPARTLDLRGQTRVPTYRAVASSNMIDLRSL